MKLYLVICLCVAHFSFAQKRDATYTVYFQDSLKKGNSTNTLNFINDSVAQLTDGRYPIGERHYRLNVLYKKDGSIITLTAAPVAEADSIELLRGYFKLPLTLYYKDEILIDEANSRLYVDYKKIKGKEPFMILNGKKHKWRKLKRLLKAKDFEQRYTSKIIEPYEAYKKFGIEGLKGVIDIVSKPEN